MKSIILFNVIIILLLEVLKITLNDILGVQEVCTIQNILRKLKTRIIIHCIPFHIVLVSNQT